MQFSSFDDLKIPGILYRPKSATSQNPAKAMIWVHGGPGGQSFKSYAPLFQFLVNHGITILAVNNRGSSGYGKTFQHASDRKHGDVDLKDCIWGKKYLEKFDWIESGRVGISGASYGGYIVASALAFTPDEFKLGVDIFGVTNWLRTLEQMPTWWGPQRAALYAQIGDPAVDRDMLIAKSPLFHSEKIRNPLLVVQGANDPRVLQAESDDLVAKVKANQVPADYLLFDDEGHGFTKQKNRIATAQRMLNFILKYL